MTDFFRKAEDVQKVFDHCKEQGYPLPTVYQGNFSAVARKQESLLFPTLRKLGISFYAYSPLAGGFLSKSKAQIEEGSGRFNSGSMYTKLVSLEQPCCQVCQLTLGKQYAKDAYLNALDQWASIAKDEGVSPILQSLGP